ncbi:hypothetical protein AB0467_02180 [Streptomyces sp. NPDC052095]|uniref:hypothetical protein n=1 Tax=unclassified Streptomyces TaxID=2593676 RepID=UPI00345059FB
MTHPRSAGHAPPSLRLVRSAVLRSVVEHGPRRMNIALAARLAETDRQFLYRNWPDREALVREAVVDELQQVLFLVSERRSEQEELCRIAGRLVRAARAVREHPVTRTTIRTDPDLLRGALLDQETPLHAHARRWLADQFPGPLERTIPHVRLVRDTLLTLAIPFAFTLAEEPHTEAESDLLDARLRIALHLCLGLAPDCPCAVPARADATPPATVSTAPTTS